MKNIIFLLTFAISSNLMASPNVGDFAVYKITAAGSTFYSRVELISYDQTTDSYLQKNTGYADDSTFSETLSTVPASKLKSKSQIQELLANCEKSPINGSLQQLHFPIGSFQTCIHTNPGKGTNYTALVPFGFIKFTDDTMLVDLIEFKFAQN